MNSKNKWKQTDKQTIWDRNIAAFVVIMHNFVNNPRNVCKCGKYRPVAKKVWMWKNWIKHLK